jgi:hypothetical protein
MVTDLSKVCNFGKDFFLLVKMCGRRMAAASF